MDDDSVMLESVLEGTMDRPNDVGEERSGTRASMRDCLIGT